MKSTNAPLPGLGSNTAINMSSRAYGTSQLQPSADAVIETDMTGSFADFTSDLGTSLVIGHMMEATENHGVVAKPESSRRKVARLQEENLRLKSDVLDAQNALDNVLADLTAAEEKLVAEKEARKSAQKKMDTQLSLEKEVADDLALKLEASEARVREIEQDAQTKETDLERRLAQSINTQHDIIQKNEKDLIELETARGSDREALLQESRGEIDQLMEELRIKNKSSHDMEILHGEETKKANRIVRRLESEKSDLRQQITSFTVDLAEKEHETTALEEMRTTNRKLEEHLKKALAINKKIRDQSQMATVHAEEVKKELEQLRSSQQNEAIIAAQRTKGEHDIAKMRSSFDSELAKTQKMVNFFKENSEKLSRQAKELKITNRNLENEVKLKEKHFDDERSRVYALQTYVDELQKVGRAL